MSNQFTFILPLFWALLSSSRCPAQCPTQSSTQPLPITASRHYVLLPTDGSTMHVSTRRLRPTGAEHLELLNVILPNTLVRQKLLSTQDITLLTGLHTQDELLVTLALLPDPKSGQVTWVPIDLDTVATRQVSWQRVADDCYTRLFNYEAARHEGLTPARRRMDLYPIIKRGKQYFAPQWQVLTEYFVLRNYPSWYPTSGDNSLINCLAHPFTPLDYASAQRAVAASELKGEVVPFLREEIVGKLLLQQATSTIYTFWSIPPIIIHGGVAEFGVGEFRFTPKVGIISGKYAGYFGLKNTDVTNTFFEVMSIVPLSAK